MAVLHLTPLLRTWDLSATVTFYEQVLGFVCEERNDKWGWARLRLGGATLMLSGPNAHEGDTQPAFTGSLHLTTDEVDAFWERVRERARVCYAPEDFAYGMREFAVYDNNGYLWQVGQPLAAAGPG